MKIGKFGEMYHDVLIAEQPLDPHHIIQPNAPIIRTAVKCVISGIGCTDKKQTYFIYFKLYSKTNGVAIAQLHYMWVV